MSDKLILYGKEARERIKAGVKILADAVSSTLGAAGKGAIIGTVVGDPHITSDGITIAESVEAPKGMPFEQEGIALMKQVCREANRVGDGTTTATVLANAFLGNDHIVEGHNVQLVRRGMENAIADVIKELHRKKKKIRTHKDLINVATIASRGDKELGTLIADCYQHIGNDGQVIVEEGRGEKSSVEHITGYQIDKGFYSDAFVTDRRRNVVEFKNPRILVSDVNITEHVRSLADALNKVANVDKNVPIVVIAPEISDDCLQMLQINAKQSVIQCVFIEAPEFGANQTKILEDVAFLTGGKMLSTAAGDDLSKVTARHFGTCDKFISNTRVSVFIDGAGSERTRVDEYVNNLPPDDDKEFGKKRLSRLTGRLSKLKIGARSAVEMREKRDRTEDSTNSVRAALEGGYIVGGGIALYRAMMKLERKNLRKMSAAEKAGYELVIHSLEAPLRQILLNLFGDDESAIDTVLSELVTMPYNMGYDARDMVYVDMIEKGIIDPVNVTISSLEAAFSVTSTILNTNFVITITGNDGDSFSHL